MCVYLVCCLFLVVVFVFCCCWCFVVVDILRVVVDVCFLVGSVFVCSVLLIYIRCIINRCVVLVFRVFTCVCVFVVFVRVCCCLFLLRVVVVVVLLLLMCCSLLC